MSAAAMGKTPLSREAQDYLGAVTEKERLGSLVGTPGHDNTEEWSRAALSAAGMEGKLSHADRVAIRDRGAGTELGRSMGYTLAVSDRIKNARGFAGGSAGGLGVGLSMKERRKLKDHPDELADVLMGKLGGDDIDAKDRGAVKEQILAYQKDVKAGHFDDAARKAQDILARGDIQKHQEKERHRKEEEKDPVASEIRDNTKKTADYLGMLMEGNKRLNVYVENMPKNDKPVESNGSNAPSQPGGVGGGV